MDEIDFDLTKPLENTRKERNDWEVRAEAAIRISADALRVEQAEHQETRNALDIARSELARLTPSGEVEADAAALRRVIIEATRNAGQRRLLQDRVTRLAAKAQGYEAIRKILADNYGTDGDPVERAKDLCESEETARRDARLEQDAHHRADLERDREAARADRAEFERDVAVADNTELLTALTTVCKNIDATNNEPVRVAVGPIMKRFLEQSHPGAALLERTKRLEEALDSIQIMGGVKGGAWCAGQAIRAMAGNPLMCTDASCEACRAGTPCH